MVVFDRYTFFASSNTFISAKVVCLIRLFSINKQLDLFFEIHKIIFQSKI